MFSRDELSNVYGKRRDALHFLSDSTRNSLTSKSSEKLYKVARKMIKIDGLILSNGRDGSLRFTLVCSLFLVILQTTSTERDTRDISGNREITRNSAMERSDGEIIENPAKVIPRFTDLSSDFFHRKKRKSEDSKNSSPRDPSPISTESNGKKIDEREERSEKINEKRSDMLENEEEEEEEDEEDMDIDEDGSHQSKKRAGNESSLNISSSGHRPARQGPKIWDRWGKWSSCSVSCGVGKLTRWRHCIGGGCSLGEKEAQFKTCTFAAC